MAIRFVTSSEPNRPPQGRHWLYVDEADEKLKLKKDDGTIVLFEGQPQLSSFYSEYYTLTSSEITAKEIVLPREVDNGSGVVFIPAGGIAQIPGTDFVVSGSTISWDGLGLDGSLAENDKVLISYTSTNSEVEFGSELFTLTPQQITAKQITLAHQPTSTNGVMLHPIGGPAQIPGEDFSISGVTLSWSGKGLDGTLAANDRLLVYYQWL